MKLLFAPFILILVFTSQTFAQDVAINVDQVDFKSVTDDWIQVEVDLSANRNPNPQARNQRFIEDINVKLYIGYEIEKGKFDFYISEVDIVIVEQGDDFNVYFYLPGLIVERDRLPTDPHSYYVEVSVGGEKQAIQPNSVSRTIQDLSVLESFTAKADSEGVANEHLLMPIYLAPGDVRGRVDKLPLFLRRDVEG